MSGTPRTDAQEQAESVENYTGENMLCLARTLERENQELRAALAELVARCDSDEGVRPDGSNIQTISAHAALGDFDDSETDGDTTRTTIADAIDAYNAARAALAGGAS